MQARTMYHVEKFLPPECPRCRAWFAREGEDYCRFLGDFIDGKKRIRATKGYTIIVCSHCDNMTVRLDLESYQIGDRSKAESLLNQGFVNLREVRAVGNMARDHHAIHMKMPGVVVEGLETDDPPLPQPTVRVAKSRAGDAP